MLLDRHGTINGLFLIRRSTRSADCLTLDICFEREKHHYVITHFVSCSIRVNLSVKQSGIDVTYSSDIAKAVAVQQAKL